MVGKMAILQTPLDVYVCAELAPRDSDGFDD